MKPIFGKLALGLVLALTTTINVYAQAPSSNSYKTNVVPPSPNAAALGKYGNIPVGLYTGVPNISIPLYEVEEGNLSLPISLSYHAGGVKLEEVASRVGLGWTLNAGGAITRTVRGLPDDGPFGYLRPDVPLPEQVTQANNDYFAKVSKNELDAEPDMFYFNFGSKSGRFVLDKQGNPVVIPHQKIKIEKNRNHDIQSWVITDEEGAKYTFAKVEYVSSLTFCNGQKVNDYAPLASTWFLTEITSSVTANKITLQYIDESWLSYKTLDSETRYVLTEATVSPGSSPYNVRTNSMCWGKMVISNPVRLAKITARNLEVNFIKSRERCDLKGDYVLDQIVIRNFVQSREIKRYILDYKYLDGNQLYDLQTACNTVGNDSGDLNDYRKRLILVSLTESGEDGIAKPPYRFEYALANNNGIGLPSRLSFAQDHWGFFNGKTLNNTLIPSSPYIFFNGLDVGADREVDVSSSKVGTLTKISYPTGGSTSFSYEGHIVDNTALKRLAITPRSVSLGVQPHLQSYGSIVETAKFNINNYTEPSWACPAGSQNPRCLNWVAGVLVPGFVVDCNSGFCPNGNQNPHCTVGHYRVEIIKYADVNDNIGSTVAVFSNIAAFVSNFQRLANGIYRIRHTVLSNTYNSVFCTPYSFTLRWNEGQLSNITNVGGLRILEIKDHDPLGGLTKSSIYEYTAENGQSSGTLLSIPEYQYQIQDDMVREICIGGNCYPSNITNKYVANTSSSNLPLMSTQGSFTGYSQVTHFQGETGNSVSQEQNGKSVSRFFSPLDFPDMSSDITSSELPTHLVQYSFPFAPIDSRDWLRGQLKSVVDYKKETGGYTKVKEVINTYNFTTNINQLNYKELFGWKIGVWRHNFVCPHEAGCQSEGLSNGLLFVKFNTTHQNHHHQQRGRGGGDQNGVPARLRYHPGRGHWPAGGHQNVAG